MAITINQGGVLHQLSKASTNDGGILRPIYGTPKDNLTLHWGGFTGYLKEPQYLSKSFLLGEFTVSGGMYYSPIIKATDTISPTRLNNISTDTLPTIPVDDDYEIISGIYRIKQYIHMSCVLRTKKTNDNNTFSYYFTNDGALNYYNTSPSKTYYDQGGKLYRDLKTNSNGIWETTIDKFSTYYEPISFSNYSLNDGTTYYVYGKMYSKLTYFYDAKYVKSGSSDYGKVYIKSFDENLPLDGLSFDIINNFQTVNGG